MLRVLSRRSFVAGLAASATFGCGGGAARTGDRPLVGPAASTGLWVDEWFGAAPTRIVVLRRPGSPVNRSTSGLFDRVSSVLLPADALAACSESEHYFYGDSIALSIARGVPATVDPRSCFFRADVCASGGQCGPCWTLVGQAPTGVMRFTEPRSSRQSLYLVPGGTWLGLPANSSADLRLGPALAARSVAMPPLSLEPGAVQLEHAQADRRLLESGFLPPYAGAELATASTVALFPAGSRASQVTYTVRVYLPDAESASKAARDINRQRAELRARDPSLAAVMPEDVRAEGPTILQAGTLRAKDIGE